jgi:hypothetical protein
MENIPSLKSLVAELVNQFLTVLQNQAANYRTSARDFFVS